MQDEVIMELWRVKDELAAHFNYDVGAIAAALRKKQGDSGHEVVVLKPKATVPSEFGCPTKPGT